MSKLDKFKEKLRKEKSVLGKRYHVRKLGIFGSFVRNQQTQKSDLDILVDFSIVPGLFGFMELEAHLSRILGVRVDLVMKKSLKPAIGRHILSEVEYL